MYFSEKKNLYRSLLGTCMSSSAGIGVICWWYWSKRTFIFVKKNIFLCPPAACIPSLGGCPLLLRSTLAKKKIISQKKPFHVSTEACNPRRCTNSCPCKVPGPSSWVLDAVGQPGLSLFLAGAVSMELLGPRGQYDGIQSNKIGYVCLLACTLSVLPGLRKILFLTNGNCLFDLFFLLPVACLLACPSACLSACLLAGWIDCFCACLLACLFACLLALKGFLRIT